MGMTRKEALIFVGILMERAYGWHVNNQLLGMSIETFERKCEDLIRFLKIQEPQYPLRYKDQRHGYFFYCPKCKTTLNDMARPKYCSECGQAVKWL